MSLVQLNLQPWQKIGLSIAVAALIGYAFGRYAQPANVVVKTQEVVKEVEVVKHDTVTVTKEIKRPDGTDEIDTTVTDKDVSQKNLSESLQTSETISNQKPQWNLGILGGYNFQDLKPDYGITVDRRILGPIFLGVVGHTDVEHTALLVHASIEF